MQLLVLGMHRSGTSAVAGVLHLLGAYMGPEGSELDVQPENPKGFWERHDVVTLHDDLLSAGDCTWDQVGSFDMESLHGERDEELEGRLAGIIEELDGHRPWFVKDPRLCLTLPLWTKRLERPLGIVVYRPAAQVAASLANRNGFANDLGLALWEAYVVSALEASRDLPRLVVSYADLTEEPIATVRALRERLGSMGVDGLRDPSDEEILEFIDPSLRHHHDESQEWLTPRQRELETRWRHCDETDDGGERYDRSPEAWRLLLRHDIVRRRARQAEESDRVTAAHRQAEEAWEAAAAARLAEEAAKVAVAARQAEEAAKVAAAARQAEESAQVAAAARLAEESAKVAAAHRQAEEAQAAAAARLAEESSKAAAAHRQAEESAKAAAAFRQENERLQRDLEHKQTEIDRRQAEIEHQQAEIVRQQAEIGRQQAEIGRQQTEIARQEAEVIRQQAEVVRQQTEIARQEAEVVRRQAEVVRRQDLLDEQGKVLASLESQVGEKAGEIERLWIAAAEQEVRRQDLEQRASGQERELEQLRGALTGSQELSARLRHWLASLDNASSALFRSRRWRVGNALGSAVSRLAGRAHRPHASDHVRRVLDEFRQLEDGGVGFEPVVPRAAEQVPVGKESFTRARRRELRELLASDERLDLGPAKSPALSIVLVLFNRAEMTLACLRSIVETVEQRCEVIIVDNASSDETSLLLSRIDGAQVIANSDNRGFVQAVNQAAAVASGEYLLLLNNDAELIAGSVEAAIDVFETEQRVGAVGGMIVLLDGRLQEAGSIVWRDGSCVGYGRGDRPGEPGYMFRRDVDFCSGAFLMTPRRVFEEVGGFDEEFSPAYYEETDYCLRLRESGLRVVYEPRALIRHYEFASFQSSADAIALQGRNHVKFAAKHREPLQQQLPPGRKHLHRARIAGGPPHALYIDDRVPHTSLGSGFPRANRVVAGLASAGYQVTVYPLNFPREDTWESAYADLSPRVEIALGHGREEVWGFLEARADLYDLVFVSRPHNMEFFARVLDFGKGVENAKIVYDAEAIFALREAERRRVEGAKWSRDRTDWEIAREVDLARHADLVFAVSAAEAQAFEVRGLKNVHILGHALGVEPTAEPFDDRKNYLFVGNLDEDESPNVDSLEWFVSEVMPRLAGMPTLEVVGSCLSPRVKALGGERVRLHGRAEEIESWYGRVRVFVAPTRFAAGLPIKICEAAARGLPVVATDLLAGQLGWAAGEELLVAPTSDAAEFAERCDELYRDADLWRRIRDGALARVRAECSPKRFGRSLHDGLASIGEAVGDV